MLLSLLSHLATLSILCLDTKELNVGIVWKILLVTVSRILDQWKKTFKSIKRKTSHRLRCKPKIVMDYLHKIKAQKIRILPQEPLSELKVQIFQNPIQKATKLMVNNCKDKLSLISIRKSKILLKPTQSL